MDSLVSVEGMGANLSLDDGQFYTLGEIGQADIPLTHVDFLNACEPVVDENNMELGTPVSFTNTASGSVSGRIFTNYQGQGKGIVIDSCGAGAIKNGTKIDFSECRMVSWEDLGRLAMQLYEFYETSNVQIRIKNIGGSPAKNIVLKDGEGNIVPSGVPINLGGGENNCSSTDTDPCYFYQNVSFTCTSLAPSTETLEFTCAISFNFAPIKREEDSVAQSHDSMFDHIGDTYLRITRHLMSPIPQAKSILTPIKRVPSSILAQKALRQDFMPSWSIKGYYQNIMSKSLPTPRPLRGNIIKLCSPIEILAQGQ